MSAYPTYRNTMLALLISLVSTQVSHAQRPVPRRVTSPTGTDWRALLERRAPTYGHRNWIVIADAAYPLQASRGIETVVTGAEHLEVVQAVLSGLEGLPHVRPVTYVDAELPHVTEEDAPDIGKYRDALKKALGGKGAIGLPHEEIIERLDKAGEKFNILVLKTNLLLPYTSVFVELDCGYWSKESEARLRETMPKKAEP